MSKRNFCIDLETGRAFVYEKTLESDYMQGRFGAIPIIEGVNGTYKSQFIHHAMKIEDPKKLAKELRDLADKLENENV